MSWLEFLELREHVAVVRLVDELRKERGPDAEQRARDLARLFHEGRVQALQDVRIGLQGQADELAELPVRLLRGLILELLGNAVQ